jgi:uncharacterized membrane protein YgaE (UPF0421/DUF939 family)
MMRPMPGVHDVPRGLARMTARLRGLPTDLRDPRLQSDLLLLVKAAVAAVVAWLLAVEVFSLPQPFLAPWAALLTVHATVYRSISHGAQQVAGTVLGVLLAFAAAQILGIGALTLGVALFAALLASRLRVIRHEGVTVATTVLFVLTTGYERQEELLLGRILDALLGIAVGVVVNLLVLPPLDTRSAARHVDHIDRCLGDLLCRMAEQIRDGSQDADTEGWIEETRQLDRDIDHAWEAVRFTRESMRMNPRRRRARGDGSAITYEDVLNRLEDGVSEARTMARTIRESTLSAQEWDVRFRVPFLDLLIDVGKGVQTPEEDVAPLRERLDALGHELSVSELPSLWWPVYGALLTNVSNIVNVVDDVGSSDLVRA